MGISAFRRTSEHVRSPAQGLNHLARLPATSSSVPSTDHPAKRVLSRISTITTERIGIRHRQQPATTTGEHFRQSLFLITHAAVHRLKHLDLPRVIPYHLIRPAILEPARKLLIFPGAHNLNRHPLPR